MIAEEILARNFDVITIVYNQFKSVISQQVARQNVYGIGFLQNNAAHFDEYEFDTDLEGAAVSEQSKASTGRTLFPVSKNFSR